MELQDDIWGGSKYQTGHHLPGTINFGGIPNSRPYAICDCMGVFLRSGFAHMDNVIPVIKAITWLLLSRLQGNKPHRNFPKPAEPTPAYTGTLRNLPEPSETCLRNLHHFTPELSGTFRNLPPELTPFYKGTLRNLLEPASGTYTSTLRNLPEPSSGTCSCDPHRHTPELIWAEDPISLRSWGKSFSRGSWLWCLSLL